MLFICLRSWTEGRESPVPGCPDSTAAATVPKWLLLHPVSATAAIGDSLGGEQDFVFFPQIRVFAQQWASSSLDWLLYQRRLENRHVGLCNPTWKIGHSMSSFAPPPAQLHTLHALPLPQTSTLQVVENFQLGGMASSPPSTMAEHLQVLVQA